MKSCKQRSYFLLYKRSKFFLNNNKAPGKSRGPEVAAPSLDYSATDRYCAEELLILLINFMK
jgi:hypothetical protein